MPVYKYFTHTPEVLTDIRKALTDIRKALTDIHDPKFGRSRVRGYARNERNPDPILSVRNPDDRNRYLRIIYRFCIQKMRMITRTFADVNRIKPLNT
jgi:hypothetical protein